MLVRTVLAIALATTALPAVAQDAECSFQAGVVGAIQKARLDRISKDRVVPGLLEANPNWPDSMEAALPGLVDWIYSQRMRDLRKTDLAAVSKQQCLDNWEQLQALGKSVSN